MLPYRPLLTLARTAARSGGIDARRLPVAAALATRYAATEPLRWVETARVARATRRQPVPTDPIFVLGHWRSGTTAVQRLLAADPRHATHTLYDTLLADVAWTTAPWLKPTLNRLSRALRVPHSLHRQPLHWDLPGEADVGLCASMSPHAYTWGHLFPRRFDDWLARCVLDPGPGWLDDLDAFVRKLSVATGRRLILKSPGDTARVAALAGHYPDARFVYVHRHPVDVFHSTRYLWGVIRREFALQTVTDAEVDAIIVRTYRLVLERYLAQRDAVGPGRLVEIRCEALADEWPRVYDALGLGPVPPEVPAIEPAGPTRYLTSPDLEARLRDAWAFAFAAWPDAPRAHAEGA